MAHHENYLDGRQADQQGFDRRLVRALLTQDQSLDIVVEDVKGKVCSKRIVQVLENLIQESDFTLADLNQLQQVLEEKKAEAVETVPCNCM